MFAMPSSTMTQLIVKRTSPSFSASKTERETITKTSVLQSSKNRKIRENGENHTLFDFFYFFRRSPQFGNKYPEYQFFTGFRMSCVPFRFEFRHQKSSLISPRDMPAAHRIQFALKCSPLFVFSTWKIKR